MELPNGNKQKQKKHSIIEQFFVNNLPSLPKFKNQDNLNWVVKYHRLRTTELFEYSLNHQFSTGSCTATLKSKFNAITRIMRLALKSKTPYLDEKFSYIVYDWGAHFEGDEYKMNNHQKKSIMSRQKQLEKHFNSIENK